MSGAWKALAIIALAYAVAYHPVVLGSPAESDREWRVCMQQLERLTQLAQDNDQILDRCKYQHCEAPYTTAQVRVETPTSQRIRAMAGRKAEECMEIMDRKLLK